MPVEDIEAARTIEDDSQQIALAGDLEAQIGDGAGAAGIGVRGEQADDAVEGARQRVGGRGV